MLSCCVPVAGAQHVQAFQMMMRHAGSMRTLALLALIGLMLSGCAGSHFAMMSDVQQAAQSEDYQRAEELLNGKKALQKARNEVLSALEHGLLAHLHGKYTESNRFLTQAADRMEELDVISITGTTSEWLISPTIQPYRGEDFERALVHYYMALNYVMLGDLPEALVECRRVNLLLQEFNDRYEHKNVYKTDAFLLYLSGIIYDALGEVNDAFIDYRHAYNAYQKDYHDFYGSSTPSQLLDHLLRTSAALGFRDSFERYKTSFSRESWPTQQEYRESARLVILWNNGQIPYKVERSFRQYVELDDDKDAGCYIKFAFPALVRRPARFSRATVTVGGMNHELEIAEDLTQIALKNLEDRRVRTLAKAATRNLVKCMAEYEVEKQNRWLGYLLGGLTELTEGADTRQWSLLPASVSLTQLLLEPGVSDVELVLSDASGQLLSRKRFEQVRLERGKTTFLIHRTF